MAATELAYECTAHGRGSGCKREPWHGCEWCDSHWKDIDPNRHVTYKCSRPHEDGDKCSNEPSADCPFCTKVDQPFQPDEREPLDQRLATAIEVKQKLVLEMADATTWVNQCKTYIEEAEARYKKACANLKEKNRQLDMMKGLVAKLSLELHEECESGEY